jgi:hypothetical protein
VYNILRTKKVPKYMKRHISNEKKDTQKTFPVQTYLPAPYLSYLTADIIRGVTEDSARYEMGGHNK